MKMIAICECGATIHEEDLLAHFTATGHRHATPQSISERISPAVARPRYSAHVDIVMETEPRSSLPTRDQLVDAFASPNDIIKEAIEALEYVIGEQTGRAIPSHDPAKLKEMIGVLRNFADHNTAKCICMACGNEH